MIDKKVIDAVQTLKEHGINVETQVMEIVAKQLNHKLKVKSVKKQPPVVNDSELVQQYVTNNNVTKVPQGQRSNQYYNGVSWEDKTFSSEIGSKVHKSIDTFTIRVLTELVYNPKHKVIWKTCMQIAEVLHLHKDFSETDKAVRIELYKSMNSSLVRCKHFDTPKRKKLIHYSLTDKGLKFINEAVK
tara:strand:- start:785 stop:1345 length:561 start_codon:yes stop_codon:yes gene_type:complete